MYKFIDTTEVSEGIVLPSEALQINGEYIENLIPGYRTLNVSGREALSPEVSTFETGVRDGSTLKGKRYPARILIVTYQLIAESNEAFRAAYNKLGGILNVDEAKLIFNDEQDKYYIGTPCTIGEVPPGKNAVVGKYEIICTDPFKYSVIEYEAVVSDGENDVTFQYNGTYKAHPILETDFYEETEQLLEDGMTFTELTGAGDCGYVAFFTDDEKIVQLGDPEEIDKVEADKSQTLMNQTLLDSTSWDNYAKNNWSINNGHIMATNVTQEGSVGMDYAYYNSKTTVYSGYTSGSLGTFYATNSACNYKVSYSTSNRTANSVKVTISVAFYVSPTNGPPVDRLNINFSIKLSNGQVIDGGLITTKNRTPDYFGKTTTIVKTKTISGLSSSQTSIGVSSFNVWGHSFFACNRTNLNSISISGYSTNTQVWAEYYLTTKSYGTATSGWHGPTVTKTLPKDAQGLTGARDFCLTYSQKLCTNSSSGGPQMGSFRMNLTDATGKNIAGVWVYKNKSGKAGNLVFYVNGKKVNETQIDLHYNNTYFGLSEDAVQTTTITKSAGNIYFAVGSYKRAFTDVEIAEVKATKVTFSFEKYGELEAMTYNGLYWAKFVKNNCPTWKNIPNKFSANDVLEADCNSGEIYLNGIPSPDLGAIGNNWEEFVINPGINSIGVACSEWVPDGYRPTFKIRYREVFL